MADNEIFTRVLEDIRDRETFARRQALWYRMRHTGIPRQKPPWPNAANTHFPLVDMDIDKFKPFFFQQLFISDTLASFVAIEKISTDFCASVERWFDYKLKHKSNFLFQKLISIDRMLLAGWAPIRVSWSHTEKCLEFDAIHPIFLVLPATTTEIQKSDRITHIQHVSKWRYENSEDFEGYNRDPGLIKRITGRAHSGEGDTDYFQDIKEQREGILYGDKRDDIVIWSVYEHTKSGWNISTFSPMAPDEPLRKSYNEPEINGKSLAPFVIYRFEVNDQSVYDSRGIPELIGTFEQSASKTWNEKLDSMTIYNRPLFTNDKEGVAQGTVRFSPGSIIGNGLRRVEMGNPPISYNEEINHVRLVAEARLSMPDFGTSRLDQPSEPKSATEISRNTQFINQVVDIRARTYHIPLTEEFNLAWRYLSKNDEDVAYLVGREFQKIPLEARDAAYSITPAGAPDNWNKQNRLQKALMRKTLFVNSPHVDQVELDKSIMEIDEPGLVERLIRDLPLKQADQMERQANELTTLQLGFPLGIKPDDDDAVHITTIAGFYQLQAMLKKPLDQLFKMRADQHLQQHFLRLHQANPQMAKQVQMGLAQMEQASAQQEQQLQQQQVPEEQISNEQVTQNPQGFAVLP